MTKPVWVPLGSPVPVPARGTALWLPAVDYVPPNRLLKLTVNVPKGAAAPTWSVSPTEAVTADGLPLLGVTTNVKLLLTTAPWGALIGKIGGSSADLPDAATAAAGPWPNRKVFAVGSYCVVNVGATDGGPLFLTINGSVDGFEHHSGSLTVTIEESIT